MLSSLGICRKGVVPRAARHHSSPYLTTSSPPPPMGGADLGTLLALSRQPAPFLRPVQEFNAVGLQQADQKAIVTPQPRRANGYNISHYSAGRLVPGTIRNMHKAVLQAKTDAKWRERIERIRQEGRRRGAIGWKDYLGELQWLNHYFRTIHPIDYVRDPHQVELVMHPEETYRKGLGDCDDSSTLWAATCGVIGAPHRFRTYRADPRRPQEWSHVVAQCWLPTKRGGQWVNNDMTIRNAPLGFEPVGFPYKDWPEPRW